MGEATEKLRQFLFQHVYTGSAAKQEEGKLREFLGRLYYFYLENPDELPVISGGEKEPLERRAADYLAGMTDHYAIADFQRRFIPKVWREWNG